MSPFPAFPFGSRRHGTTQLRDDAHVPVTTPLAAVRGAIADGAVSRADIADRTGLARATVDAAIEHLERTGSLRRERMASSCPSSGCGGCAHAAADGSACSSSSNGAGDRGPVALVLTRRR